jgi:hypothetical protein
MNHELIYEKIIQYFILLGGPPLEGVIFFSLQSPYIGAFIEYVFSTTATTTHTNLGGNPSVNPSKSTNFSTKPHYFSH